MGVKALVFGVLIAASWGCQPHEARVPRGIPAATELAIIPFPTSLSAGEGWVSIDRSIRITHNACGAQVADRITATFSRNGIQVSDEPSSVVLKLQCVSQGVHLGKTEFEAYTLKITGDSIVLMAENETGLFRGAQTLIQLTELYTQDGKLILPILEIEDQPTFPHRGMLLDVCRHFFDVETIKAYIDHLAYYKMNTLHWHLTEDQGWRIAVDAYPKLTEIGAWRIEANGDRYGGFYTKEEIRDIVAYAQERHIQIIPEIEMPGHAQAALAAYPELSCTGGPFEVANDWGVFKEIYCAGNDSVFEFLETVLDEVMEMFPSKYIHIGGDEAPKYRWEQCPKCQQRIEDEGLNDAHELQSWFIAQIDNYLNEKGRILIGWDEILEGGLAENAVVQSWRGMEGGIAATISGHPAIMSPTSHCYFDYDLRSTDLEEVYQFDPVSDSLGVDAKALILGGECNLWSEHIPDRATLDRQTFPRMLAMSEVLWTAPAERNYTAFQKRVYQHYPLLDEKDVRYGAETYPLSVRTRKRNDSLLLELLPSPRELELFVSDSTSGIDFYYNDEIYIPSNTERSFRVQPMRNGRSVDSPIKIDVRAHSANYAKTHLYQSYHNSYTGGGQLALVDGLLGTTDFRDGRWQGYFGNNFETLFDLGSSRPISHLGMRCLQYNNAWIFLPTEVRFLAGSDSTMLTAVGSVYPQSPPEKRGKFIENLELRIDTLKARYVKVIALNLGHVPDWHEAAGSDAWIFTDEIIVE